MNYSIYYYRRLILKEDDATARRLDKNASKNFQKENSSKLQKGKDEKSSLAEREEKPALYDLKKNKPNYSEPPLLEENRIINGLWIGTTLSKIEILTIKSFIAKGHTFRLWAYDRIRNPLPFAGLEIADATQIIPRNEVFSYRKANKYGHGKGSYGGFSDIFRYKMLNEHGGWWVDMDVTCVKPLNFSDPYFFRSHHDLAMVGNVMKCPKGSEVMKACYERAKTEVTADNTDWHKPIEILNHFVFEFGLQNYIFENISNEDKWTDLRKLIKYNIPIPENYFVIHWMNEEWRSRGIDKNDIRFSGVLGRLMQEYGLLKTPESAWREFTNSFRHTVWIPVYENVLKA